MAKTSKDHSNQSSELTALEQSAKAAFEQGKIAEKNLDYYTAYEHFARAAGFEPDNPEYLNEAGSIAGILAKYQQQIVLLEKSLDIYLLHSGEDSPQVAALRNNLGGAYYDLGEYDKTIVYFEQALSSNLNTYGEDHPDVAIRRNNLGETYRALGQYEKAIEYFQQALISGLSTYGEDHPVVAIRRNNLGLAYQALGQYKKAIVCFQQALNSSLNTYSEGHPDVATYRNNLGSVYADLGQYDKAIEYYQLALATLEKVFDKTHPYCESTWGLLSEAKKAIANKNQTQKPIKVDGYRSIKAPALMSVYDSETIAFIDKIKRYLGTEKCLIDFSDTQEITDAALIVIYGTLASVQRQAGLEAKIIESQSQQVKQILKTSYLQKLIEQQVIDYDFASVALLPVVQCVGKVYFEAIVDYIQRDIYDNQMAVDTEYMIGDAIAETINNVRLHAYPGCDDSDKSWWLLCRVRDGQLHLSIYDSGVGVPKTIAEKYPGMQNTSDEQLIKLSMTGDVSGTNQSKHGQGSKSIRALVEHTDGGKLRVFSNKGLYAFEQGKYEPDLLRLPSTLPGTLVQWNIKLK